MSEIKKLIASVDYQGLRDLLSSHPSLANAGIPYDDKNPTLAHPLHRICDGVFNETYSDEQGVELAKIFLDHGANIDGLGFLAANNEQRTTSLIEKKDTPLITAASLTADKVCILYLERGANISHAGTHGGTALHWAAWTGRDTLVEKLIKAGADIHKKCIDFKNTPLQWAAHGYKFDGGRTRHHQIECIRLLVAAGAENTSDLPLS
ncbi:MAG TPA: ankyrin repeat domain-containing protein [Cyclobacteriaceae bacterium]|nr:ankyrin repeat domain-containing protein [Cyclobacteriaceae bacterium]